MIFFLCNILESFVTNIDGDVCAWSGHSPLTWINVSYFYLENQIFSFFITLIIQNVSFIVVNNHCLEIHFIWYKYSHPSILMVIVCLVYLFSSQPLTSVKLFEVSFLINNLLDLSSLATFTFYLEYLTI